MIFASDEIESARQTVARQVNDSQSLNLSHKFFLLERRRRQLDDERQELEKSIWRSKLRLTRKKKQY